MMCSFDLETTGTDPESDRIVTACVTWLDGAGKAAPQVRNWLAWPGCDIPDAATAVHHVTTEHAREHGLPAAQVAGEVCEAVLEAAGAGIPVIAFNAAYDLTLLDRETRRHGLDPLIPGMEAVGALVIDPWVLDLALDRYRKGKRQLGMVAEHYGVKAGEAHSADGDAVTAARVAWKIAARYPHIAEMDPAGLREFQASARRVQAMSLQDYLRRQGKEETVDGSWPWRQPAAERAGAA